MSKIFSLLTFFLADQVVEMWCAFYTYNTRQFRLHLKCLIPTCGQWLLHWTVQVSKSQQNSQKMLSSLSLTQGFMVLESEQVFKKKNVLPSKEHQVSGQEGTESAGEYTGVCARQKADARGHGHKTYPSSLISADDFRFPSLLDCPYQHLNM